MSIWDDDYNFGELPPDWQNEFPYSLFEPPDDPYANMTPPYVPTVPGGGPALGQGSPTGGLSGLLSSILGGAGGILGGLTNPSTLRALTQLGLLGGGAGLLGAGLFGRGSKPIDINDIRGLISQSPQQQAMMNLMLQRAQQQGALSTAAHGPLMNAAGSQPFAQMIAGLTGNAAAQTGLQGQMTGLAGNYLANQFPVDSAMERGLRTQGMGNLGNILNGTYRDPNFQGEEAIRGVANTNLMNALSGNNPQLAGAQGISNQANQLLMNAMTGNIDPNIALERDLKNQESTMQKFWKGQIGEGYNQSYGGNQNLPVDAYNRLLESQNSQRQQYRNQMLGQATNIALPYSQFLNNAQNQNLATAAGVAMPYSQLQNQLTNSAFTRNMGVQGLNNSFNQLQGMMGLGMAGAPTSGGLASILLGADPTSTATSGYGAYNQMFNSQFGPYGNILQNNQNLASTNRNAMLNTGGQLMGTGLAPLLRSLFQGS